jgi:hypothetical protein
MKVRRSGTLISCSLLLLVLSVFEPLADSLQKCHYAGILYGEKCDLVLIKDVIFLNNHMYLNYIFSKTMYSIIQLVIVFDTQI